MSESDMKWSVKLGWEAINKNYISSSVQVEFLSFTGAEYDLGRSTLPIYSKRILVNTNGKCIWTLANEVYVDVDVNENRIVENENVNENINLVARIGYDKGNAFSNVSFIPIRRKKNSNLYEKLTSFDLILRIVEESELVYSKSHSTNFGISSILHSGVFYKIGISSSGIYKLDYEYIKNLGIDVDHIDPRNIKLYGNGGGMLPKLNSAKRADDLLENAVFISGESDGDFNEEDYLLFYGGGPDEVTFNYLDKTYSHVKNIYSNQSYYFITVSTTEGLRIEEVPSSDSSITNSVSSFDDIIVHELDEHNLIKSGSEWFGEVFETQVNYSFNHEISNPDPSSTSHVTMRCIARSADTSSFMNLLLNGELKERIEINKINPLYYTAYYKAGLAEFDFLVEENLDLQLSYDKYTTASFAWLDYYELEVRRLLIYDNSPMLFFDKLSVGAGNVSEFTIGNYSSSSHVWNITDNAKVYSVQGAWSNDSFSFVELTDSLNKYVVFQDEDDFLVPISFEVIVNQNLHAEVSPDMVIISPQSLLLQANRLAQFHRDEDDLTVLVVTPNEIYNEFSSGALDVVAIRDFLRMFYERSNSEFPLYLLLFGDGSYDSKDRIEGNNNLIPSYQSPESSTSTLSYVSDDYFAFLDPTEGVWNAMDADYLDLGVGRIPVNTIQEARQVVDKIMNYYSKNSIGKWRNIVGITSDDEDSNIHQIQAETLAEMLEESNKVINVNKIYLDAFKQVTTGAGDLVPGATEALDRLVESGALFINYTGHGGELGWTEEGFLRNSNINNWNNINNLPYLLQLHVSFLGGMIPVGFLPENT
ncbi:MAG: type IX secretion system sortase PorU [Flavobacteriales bacterium]|nr:type IX secretion system sortase PorU [Flavobacteriales bacterium]